MPPTVSILIPCYNCERFLGDTLDAVIAQTFSDWECVVVDDASTDGSAGVIADYATRDPRIRPVLLERNLGAAGARNAGLREIRGEYLAFLDADDHWLPEKLEAQLHHARETEAPIVHTSYRFIDEDGNFLPGGVLASDRVDLATYMRNTEIGMSTSLIHRERAGDFAFRDLRLCQDTDLWLELLRRGHVARGLRDCLVHYRVRKGQLSGSKLGMARQVFALWMRMDEVGPLKRLWYFGCYAVNGVRKRRRAAAQPSFKG